MSEENIKLPLAKQATEPDDVSLKSNSTGKSNSSKNAKKDIPQYLRASTASCHDYCKYGRRQAFEEKQWRPMRRRVAAKPPDIDGQITAENEVLLSSKEKSPGVKLNISSEASSHVADSQEIIKHEISTKLCSSRRSSLGTEVGGRKKAPKADLYSSSDSQTHSVDINKHELSIKTLGSQNLLGDEDNDIRKAGVVAGENNSETNFKTASEVKSYMSAGPDIVQHEESRNSRFNQNSEEPRFLSKRKKTRAGQNSCDLNSKARLSDASEITKHGLPSGKLTSFYQKTSQKISSRSGSSKIKPAAVEVSSSTDSPGVWNGRNRSGPQTGNKAEASNAAVNKVATNPAASSKVAVRKASVCTRASTSKISALKVNASPTLLVGPRSDPTRVSTSILKKQRSQKAGRPVQNCQNKKSEPNQPNVEEVAEKTLYVIEDTSDKNYVETEDNKCHDEPHSCSSSMPNPQLLTAQEGADEVESKSKAAITSEDGSVKENGDALDKEVRSLKKKTSRAPRNAAADGSETNTPRKLRFRQGRTLEEKQNAKNESERRIFKQRVEVECSESSSQAGSEKVVLKHQDKVGKKDAEGLLNNLIEETASKLVETRKSKVKALVGAFESVISTKKPDLGPMKNAVSGVAN